ncbi:MAG: NACHT domain-containing protein [Pseudanabaenaceae cyanobacterium bins.39]|nr:NACHT domain-containing protein [Pseudanabaenaceae cyanobacterium bins.39]
MFPEKFLIKLAQIHNLSIDQENVFLLRFSKYQDDRDVVTALGISEEAYRKRMGEIYRKFDISGRGPGKNNRLLHILQNHFDKETYQPINTQPNNFPQTTNIEELVQKLRTQSHQIIQERCATMRVLDMSHPINLESIYTSTDILEKITSHRRLGIAELLNTYHNHDRLAINNAKEERVSSIEILNRYSKIILLGKPGAGKTTFLKYTALKCSQGNIFAEAVPIFITLRQYASIETKPSLIEYIIQDFHNQNITEGSAAKQILQQGRALILLDGLDEIREEDLSRIIEEIRQFSDCYYLNRFIISSRLGAQEYLFEKFTEVEVANFQPLQISHFAKRWFANNPQRIDTFLRKVEDQKPLQELATNPLLLTLLCLVFDEYGDFPTNRSELYREGLDVLLKKWDAKRNIERYQLYKNLSMQRKEDLLSQIAYTTFKQGDYFFKKSDLEQYISNYIRNLPKAKTTPSELQLDSEAIIKAIESQHGLFVERAKGIYSFSHLTFQEYLTARAITHNSNPNNLKQLASKITDHRWHDILRLSVNMMHSADELLIQIKEECDQLLANDSQLQKILQWAQQKAEVSKVTSNLQSVRAFYITLVQAITQSTPINLANLIARILVLDLDLCQNHNLNIDLALDLAQGIENQTSEDLDLDLDLNLALEYANEASNQELAQAIQKLIQICPDNSDSNNAWTQWTNKLREESIKHRDIGHRWDLTNEQLKVLRQYCEANKLLIECLESDSYITQEVREKIQKQLLLPKQN